MNYEKWGGMSSHQPIVTHYAVRRATFRRARFGWRGYCTDDVDAFLDRVEVSLRAYSAKLTAALAEVQRVKNWRREHGIPEQRVLPTPAAVHLYARAQLEAERLVAEARRTAAHVEHQARVHYEGLITQSLVCAEQGVIDTST